MNLIQTVAKIGVFRQIKPLLIIGMIAMILGASMQLVIPLIIGSGIDNIIISEQSSYSLSEIIVLAFTFAAAFCAAGAIRFYCFDIAGIRLVTQIRRKLFIKLLHMPVVYFDTTNIGELNSRLLSDVETLKQTLSTNFAITLRSIIVLLGGVILLLTISLNLSLIAAFLIPATMIMAKYLGDRIKFTATEIQQSSAESMHIVNESLINFKLLKAFNRTNTQSNHYHYRTDKFLYLSARNTFFISCFKGFSSFISYSAILVIILVGSKQIQDGELTTGELGSFIIYALMTSMAFSSLTACWTEWKRAQGSSEKILSLLNTKFPNEKMPGTQEVELRGNIEVKGVNFSYPNKSDFVLEDINFDNHVGDIVAIVGPSGAGKSTLFNLLMGFYKPTMGEILFDGVPQTAISNTSLSKHIALVEQEPKLFSTSILKNISFAISERDVELSEVQNAAKLANIHDFICSLPNGYDTEVGPNGAQLSGGQKQRIAIARAILRNPSILLLDEATSALDTENERAVQDALKYLMKGRTTYIIAHRLSTIIHADKIIVLKAGKIAQIGKHSKLVAENGSTYQQLIHEQSMKSA